jgi:hypothetical protein
MRLHIHIAWPLTSASCGHTKPKEISIMGVGTVNADVESRVNTPELDQVRIHQWNPSPRARNTTTGFN